MYNPKSHVVIDRQNLLTNFVSENNVFINDEITNSTCAYMLADMYHLIADPAIREMNIYINSPGGDISTLVSILSCLELAKATKLTVRTIVTGLAASSASMIAIVGDKRYMGEYAKHFIHFGSVFNGITKESEIEKANIYNKSHMKLVKELYLRYTKLTKEKLDKLMEDEYGYIDAKTCKKLGLVDELVKGETIYE